MSAYLIFVIVLTVAYVIYYGVTAYRDLSAKNNEAGTDEENFDISSMEEDVATPVSETSQGFQVGVSESGNMPENDDDAILTVDEERETADQSELEEKARKISEGLEDADVRSEQGLRDTEFMELLNSERTAPSIFKIKTVRQDSGTQEEEIRI